jgi:ATP-dependent Lon protease
MSDDLVKRLRDPAFGTETSERLLMVAAADRIEQLVASNEYLNSRLENVLAREAETYAEHKELLEAARADAKEAEAYADELAKDQVDLCRQLIAAEDKLAKAVELVTFASNMDVTDWSEALDVKDQARTTLAEIEGSDAP